jgi:hypothetical protein
LARKRKTNSSDDGLEILIAILWLFYHAIYASLKGVYAIYRWYKGKGTSNESLIKEAVFTGYIYILLSKKYSDIVKIGMTTNTVKERVSGAQNSSTYLYAPVTIEAEIPVFGATALEVEALIHKKLDKFRTKIELYDGKVATEWFTLDPEQAINIARGIATEVQLGL